VDGRTLEFLHIRSIQTRIKKSNQNRLGWHAICYVDIINSTLLEEVYMKLKPLGDRVLVKPIEESEQKYGNIIIPDTAKEKPQQGEIVSVGPGKMKDDGSHIALTVKTGQKILYGKYAGTEIQLDGAMHLIMNESDILGIIE
jgi:chaperonin GroES